MRKRAILAGALLAVSFIGLSWGTMASAAAPTVEPTPLPSGSSQIGFTVVGTASPAPPAGGGSGGGHGGSGGGGNAGGGGVTPPACVPSTKTPSLTALPGTKPATLTVDPGRVAQGQDVLVRGSGFLPGEKVVIGLYPSPVKLGTFTVRTNGQIYEQVTIPNRTQLGGHTLRAIGFQDCHVAAGSVDVVSPRGSGVSIFPWIVWLIAGSAVGLAGAGILLAFVLGWSPLGATVGVATKVTP